MKITIEINAEDRVDVKLHLSMIRQQVLHNLSGKSDPEDPDELSYTGVYSNHTITIKEE